MSPIKKLMLQQCRTTKSCQNKKKKLFHKFHNAYKITWMHISPVNSSNYQVH